MNINSIRLGCLAFALPAFALGVVGLNHWFARLVVVVVLVVSVSVFLLTFLDEDVEEAELIADDRHPLDVLTDFEDRLVYRSHPRVIYTSGELDPEA